MKVAVTAMGSTLQAVVDPRFGRCSTFVIVETADMTFEAVENENWRLTGEAGIRSATFLANRGVSVVLTGNCGPKAHQTLSAAGVEVVVGCSGQVAEVVGRFSARQLRPARAPNVPSHSGTGGGE
ncbi:MAG: NifB/NifX family molybdenum-iron cluster-binding protein [Polyangiaceae bacterium]|nr:NifB/NifX family molybdenum-iron cluster-binding protein [Polyangiaceae bacterium]